MRSETGRRKMPGSLCLSKRTIRILINWNGRTHGRWTQFALCFCLHFAIIACRGLRWKANTLHNYWTKWPKYRPCVHVHVILFSFLYMSQANFNLKSRSRSFSVTDIAHCACVTSMWSSIVPLCDLNSQLQFDESFKNALALALSVPITISICRFSIFSRIKVTVFYRSIFIKYLITATGKRRWNDRARVFTLTIAACNGYAFYSVRA